MMTREGKAEIREAVRRLCEHFGPEALEVAAEQVRFMQDTYDAREEATRAYYEHLNRFIYGSR